MEECLECLVCHERFDFERRRPKLLQCGHTVCLECCVKVLAHGGTQNDMACPMDRKITQSGPADLNDNFYILGMLEKGPKQKRYWCLNCKKVADDICEEKHDICRLRKARSKLMAADLEALEKMASLQRKLLEKLLHLAPDLAASVKRSVEQCSESQRRDQDTLARLYDGLEEIGPHWDEIRASASEASVRSKTHLPGMEKDLELLEASATCTLVIRSDTGNAAWKADFHLGGESEEQPLLRYLLLLLRRSEQLKSTDSGNVTLPFTQVNAASSPQSLIQLKEEPRQPQQQQQQYSSLQNSSAQYPGASAPNNNSSASSYNSSSTPNNNSSSGSYNSSSTYNNSSSSTPNNNSTSSSYNSSSSTPNNNSTSSSYNSSSTPNNNSSSSYNNSSSNYNNSSTTGVGGTYNSSYNNPGPYNYNRSDSTLSTSSLNQYGGASAPAPTADYRPNPPPPRYPLPYSSSSSSSSSSYPYPSSQPSYCSPQGSSGGSSRDPMYPALSTLAADFSSSLHSIASLVDSSRYALNTSSSKKPSSLVASISLTKKP